MGASSSANSLQNQSDRPSGPAAVLFCRESWELKGSELIDNWEPVTLRDIDVTRSLVVCNLSPESIYSLPKSKQRTEGNSFRSSFTNGIYMEREV